ncbi:pyocin knob domain-containing protein [Bacillus pretiosus]|uniref:pyocin knob domain-containing protein n=1 Tax=Bacillus pretiosus TaxID=2983392 RepID=UPI003D64FB2C
MVIQKARANHHDGTKFNTIHYETQTKQVKVLDANGAVTSDIEEMLFKGKPVQSVSLATVKDTGLYQIKDCTDAPVTMSAGVVYLLSVESVGLISKQTFFDRTTNTMYVRPIYNGTAGTWIALGKATKDSIDSIQTSLNSLSSSVTAIDGRLKTAEADIDKAEASITSLNSQMGSHKHDNLYLKLSGGSLTGKTSMANNVSYAGKNASGADLNIGRVDASNQVALGDTGARTVLHASNGEVKVYDGSNSYKVFHEGNDGAGSGLDADKLDGLQANQFARVDEEPNFQKNVIVTNGKDIVLRAPAGSMNSGDLIFAEGGNGEIGRVFVDDTGTLVLRSQFYGDMRVRGDGVITSDYGIEFNSKNKETRVHFKANDSDVGMGFYMNNNSRQMGLYDWQHDRYFFTANRNESSIEFNNQIKIQGKRLHIRGDAPSNASYGDIWIQV